MSSCPTCASEAAADAVYCHRCGSALSAPPDRAAQLGQLELRLMEAETHKAEIETRWLREREEQRSEAARKARSARALAYNLVGLALLLLMIGYLFACAMWVRETRLEGHSAWTLAAFAAVFVTAIGLLVAAEMVEGANKKEVAREEEREMQAQILGTLEKGHE